MKYDIITIGDSFEDVFALPEEMKIRNDRSYASGFGVSFELGDKIALSEVDYEIGGSACNVVVGLSRLGLSGTVVSVIGKDTAAERIKERLSDENVDISNMIVDASMKTNFSVVFRFDQGRTIFVYHGLKDYSKLLIKDSASSKWIFLAPCGDHFEELQNNIVARVAESGTKLAWNPGSIQIKQGATKFLNLLKNTSVLFLNREEAAKFLRLPVIPSEGEVLKRLHNLGPKIVVMTKGKKGAVAFDGTKTYKIGVLETAIRVDSTGAGDSFATGFLGKIILDETESKDLSEKTLEEALKWGVLNSNSVIQYIGAQKGLMTKAEIEQLRHEYGRLKVEIG